MKINALKIDFGLSGLDSHLISLTELFPNEITVFTSTNTSQTGFRTEKELYHFSLLNPDRNTEYKISEELLSQLADCEALYFPNAHREENQHLVQQLASKVKIINRCGNFIKSDVEAKLFKNFIVTIVPSEYLKAGLVEKGINSEHIQIIYNPIPARFFHTVKSETDAFRTDLHLTDKKIILYPGRISSAYHMGIYTRRKGLEETIQALVPIIQKDPSVVFLIGGADVYQGGNPKLAQEALISFAVSVGLLPQNLVFIPEQYCTYEKFHMAMQAAYIIVHFNTKPEPFGQSVVESMACGKPVIITPYTGAKEIAQTQENFLKIENKQDANIVLVETVGELEEALDVLLPDESLREFISLQAQKTAEPYHMSHFKDKFMAVYNQIMH